jgi:hypothetical protein
MLTWLAFWFAFRSKRENMWRDCAIYGVIAGIVTAFFDWQTMRHGEEWGHPEYAAIANNSRLIATAMLLDFFWAFFAVLGICWFGWICRWCFIWRKETEHPPITPVAGALWRFGNAGWKLALVIATPIALLAIAAGFYLQLPALLEKALTFKPPPPAATATIAPPLVVTPSAPRALPVVTPTAPRVERALPVPTATPSPTPTHRKHHTKK